jgi:protein SCO1/2
MIKGPVHAVALAAVLLASAACSGGGDEAVSARCVTDVPSVIGGPIALMDQTGRAVTQADFAGSPTLLYFGFASCPDICPTSLQAAGAALDQLEDTSVKVALVTLDPERDDQQTLAAYVESPIFPDGLIGLRGDRDAIDAAATAFRVVHRRRDDPDSALGYTIDHSSFFYLMDGDWRTRALFPSSLPPEEIARCIEIGLTDG